MKSIVITEERMKKELTPQQYERYKKALEERGFEEAVSVLPSLKVGHFDNVHSSVNSNIKKLRLENGLTQTELANILDVSQKEYWRYEQDRYSINIFLLAQLAIFYNVSLDWISGFHDERKKFYDDSDGSFINGYNLKLYKEAKEKGVEYDPNKYLPKRDTVEEIEEE